MSKSTINMITPEGDVKQYTLFSARLPAFLQAFPKEKGYQVKIESTDPMSHKPGLMKLYEAAIAAGKNPTELGLPVFAAANTMVFTASLLDPEGRVLESASALRVITAYKDWEKGETAARQRLAAALGFGGDCFDADEKSDMKDQGLTTSSDAQQAQCAVASTSSGTQEAAPKTEKQETTDVKAAAPTESKTEPDTAPSADSKSNIATASTDTTPATATANADAMPAPATGTGSSNGASPAEEIPPRIIRQIQHQARLKGVVDIPPYSTVKEAKQVLKDLMTR